MALKTTGRIEFPARATPEGVPGELGRPRRAGFIAGGGSDGDGSVEKVAGRTMNRLRSFVLVLAMAGACFGQARKACFAFMLKGDVSVSCEGQKSRVTHRVDIEDFAISDELSSLGFVTSRITRRTASSEDVVYTTTLIDLKSGKEEALDGETRVVSTCGGIFWASDERRQHSGTRNLVTGEEISMPSYNWFRCSADKRVVVGMVKDSTGDL